MYINNQSNRQGQDPMSIINKRLQDHGFLQDLHNDCGIFQMELDQFSELKDYVQSLMN